MSLFQSSIVDCLGWNTSFGSLSKHHRGQWNSNDAGHPFVDRSIVVFRFWRNRCVLNGMSHCSFGISFTSAVDTPTNCRSNGPEHELPKAIRDVQKNPNFERTPNDTEKSRLLVIRHSFLSRRDRSFIHCAESSSWQSLLASSESFLRSKSSLRHERSGGQSRRHWSPEILGETFDASNGFDRSSMPPKVKHLSIMFIARDTKQRLPHVCESRTKHPAKKQHSWPEWNCRTPTTPLVCWPMCRNVNNSKWRKARPGGANTTHPKRNWFVEILSIFPADLRHLETREETEDRYRRRSRRNCQCLHGVLRRWIDWESLSPSFSSLNHSLQRFSSSLDGRFGRDGRWETNWR